MQHLLPHYQRSAASESNPRHPHLHQALHLTVKTAQLVRIHKLDAVAIVIMGETVDEARSPSLQAYQALRQLLQPAHLHNHNPSPQVRQTTQQSVLPNRRSKKGAAAGGGAKSNSVNGTHHQQSSDNSGQEATAPPPKVAARRQQFGGKLTGAASNTQNGVATNASKPSQQPRAKKPAVKVPAVVEPVEYADLRSRLLAELSSGEYDCVICYSTVTTRQATGPVHSALRYSTFPVCASGPRAASRKPKNTMQCKRILRFAIDAAHGAVLDANTQGKTSPRSTGAGAVAYRIHLEVEVPTHTVVASVVVEASVLTAVQTLATLVLALRAR